MKQNIRFRGLSFNKDEQSADHGELSLCAGVELHDGALRPSVLDGTKVDNALKVGNNNATLRYVHQTPSYTHFIGTIGKVLYWFTENGTLGNQTAIHDFDSDEIISINSVGNTLLVMTLNGGIHYILWKESDYKYLGTQIPFLPIEFRPTEQKKGKYDRSTVPNNNYEGETYVAWRALDLGDEPYNAFHKSNEQGTADIESRFQSAITEGVHAIVNQANNIVAKDGHFYAPFLIRYCYRLYDGSMVMHSAPVFMNISHPLDFKVYCVNVDRMVKRDGEPLPIPEINVSNGPFRIHQYEGEVEKYWFDVEENKLVLQYMPNNAGIEYFISDSSQATDVSPILEELKTDWTDIVKSVDFFVSAPLVREDYGELVKRMVVEEDLYGVRRRYVEKYMGTLWRDGETRRDEESRPWDTVPALWKCDMIFDFPMLSEEAYLQKICNTSNFYKIATYKLEELRSGYADGAWAFRQLNYDKSVIPNITVQEEMKDDYHTHNQLLPINDKSGMYVYNHRLNLYGMKEKLFKGFFVRNMIHDVAYDSYHNHVTDISDIRIELNTEEGKKYVNPYNNAGPISIHSYCLTKGLFFYPDARATRMYIKLYDDRVVVLAMEPHSFLNGAVVKEAFYKDDLEDFIQNVTFPESVDAIVPLPNRIITSEVDNPYYFPLEGRNAVGVGSVIGIAAVTRALSQGQVGDHDLVVFSTDGIWVLKVSSTGTYMEAHNISREVCSNPRSICQLDQSIIFATQRSLSKFVESDVASISDVLDGPIPNLVTMLPGLEEWFRIAEGNTPAGSHPDANIWQMLNWGTPAVDMFNQGRVFYDYAGLRVIVLPADTSNASVALVFSIRDLAWSTMCVPVIKAVIPGYPSPFVQLGDGKVMILDKQYDYTVPQNAVSKTGLIVTRTLTFSDTMDVLRGFRQLTDCAQMPLLFFYGSSDQRTWKMIGLTARDFYEYMPGHPYRFFRIAINTSMHPNEEYQQLELEIISKYAKL